MQLPFRISDDSMRAFLFTNIFYLKSLIIFCLLIGSNLNAQPWGPETNEFKVASDRAVLKMRLENYYKAGLQGANQTLDPYNYTSLWSGKLAKPLRKFESLVSGRSGPPAGFHVKDLEAQEQGIRDLMRRSNIQMNANEQMNFFNDLGQHLKQIEKSGAAMNASDDFMKSVARLQSEVSVATQVLELTKGLSKEEMAQQFRNPESPLAKKFVEMQTQTQQLIEKEFGELKERLDQEARTAEDRAVGEREEALKREEAQFRVWAASEASMFFSSLISQKNPELGRRVFLVTQAGIKISSAISAMNNATVATASVALGGYFAMANAGFMLVQAFGSSQKSSDQIILEQLQAISEQLNDIRNEMHKGFHRIEGMIGDLHHDMWTAFSSMKEDLETNRRIGIETKNIVESIEAQVNVQAKDYSQAFQELVKLELGDRRDDCLGVQSRFLDGRASDDLLELKECIYKLGLHLNLMKSMSIMSGVENIDQPWWDYIVTRSFSTEPYRQINAVRAYSYKMVGLTPPSVRLPNIRDFTLNTSFLADFSNSIPEFARELSADAERIIPEGNYNGRSNPYVLSEKFRLSIDEWQRFLLSSDQGPDDLVVHALIRGLFSLDEDAMTRWATSEVVDGEPADWVEALHRDLHQRSAPIPFYLYNSLGRVKAVDAPIVFKSVISTMRSALENLWAVASSGALNSLKLKEYTSLKKRIQSRMNYVKRRQEDFGEPKSREEELLGETREAVVADLKLVNAYQKGQEKWDIIELYRTAARTTIHLGAGNKQTKDKVGGLTLPLHFDELVELFGDEEALEEIFVAASMNPKKLEAIYSIEVLGEERTYRYLTGLRVILKFSGVKFLDANFSFTGDEYMKYRSCVINRGNISRGYDNIAFIWEKDRQFQHKPHVCQMRKWVMGKARQFIRQNPEALEAARQVAARSLEKRELELKNEFNETLKKVADVADGGEAEKNLELLSRQYFAGYRMLQLLSEFTFPSSSEVNYEMRRLLSGPYGHTVGQSNMNARKWAEVVIKETGGDSILWNDLHANGLEKLLYHLDSLEVLFANLAVEEKERQQRTEREPIERFVGLDYQMDRLNKVLLK